MERWCGGLTHGKINASPSGSPPFVHIPEVARSLAASTAF